MESQAELIRRARDGDVDAFDALIHEHYADCLRYATWLLGNRADAEDVVQDSFVRAFHALSRYAHDDRFRPWLLRIVRNRLETARAQLGNGATEAELVAAASALYVGIAPASLAHLRALRPHDSLAMPLIALAYFVKRGVAADASLRWVESMVSVNVAPDDVLKVQQLIDADVRAGAEARAASETRVEALLLRYRTDR